MLADAKQKAAKEGKGFELPKELAWLKRLKFYGDLRLRYQYGEVEDALARDRARLRARLGMDVLGMQGLSIPPHRIALTVKVCQSAGP